MPVNNNPNNKKCCTYSKSTYKTAGIGRIFNKPRASPIDNRYVSGSGVGAKSIFARRALRRRANSKANGEPCCDKNSIIKTNEDEVTKITTDPVLPSS